MPGPKPEKTELIECIELPILVVDRACAITRFNPAAAALLSLAPSDYGRSLVSIRLFREVPNLVALCEHVIAGGSSSRLDLLDDTGSWFSLKLGCYRESDNHVAGAVLTLTNVTAFRESLERAIEEREYTKAVINTVAEALVVVDGELLVQAGNQAFYTLFQTSRESSQGVPLYSLGDQQWDILRLRELLSRSSLSNVNLEALEIEQEFPTGTRRTLLLNARRLIRARDAGQSTLIAIQDITERKQAQEALRQSSAQLQTLINEAPLGICLIDSEFRIREVNATALMLFDNLPGLIGRDFEEVLHLTFPSKQADEIVEQFRNTLSTGQPHFTPEFVRTCEGAADKFYEWQVHRLPIPNGNFGIVCYLRDTSAQVYSREALIKSEKLAAAGRMAAAIAHEINNPLEAVTNLLYLLRSSLTDTTGARNLAMAEEELERVARITKKTLAFYRDTSTVGQVLLSEVIDSVLPVYSKRIKSKNIHLIRVDEGGSVHGYRGELQQLFSNLIANAIDAVSDGGRIELSTIADEQGTVFSVTDDGVGVREDHMPKLFEAFFSTKGKHMGTGLGLWICREIAQKNGAEIAVLSSTDPANHGTTFKVIFGTSESQKAKSAITGLSE